MKKLLLLCIVAGMIVGCGEHQAKENKSLLVGYSTVEIDSCEYLYGYYRLAHKGNCKFCQERRKAELREIVNELKK